MSKRTALILGATSAMARATAHALARKGYTLVLAGRQSSELERTAQDIELRYGVRAHALLFDADRPETHPEFFHTVIRKLESLEGVVTAVGDLGSHEEAIRDFDSASRTIQRNYTGVVSILTLVANYLEQQRKGFVIGITSVAGDRGRQSNYVYGSAKGALSLFLQGLRNRLCPSGVRVITVKPGFVDTRMTYGMKGLFLVADPEDVGNRIVGSLSGRSDVVYIPWFWRYIMLIIKHLPERLFKKMKL